MPDESADASPRCPHRRDTWRNSYDDAYLSAMHGLGQLLAVSLIVMGLSHTIARERICEPLRARLGGKETWFGYMVSCPYCLSHWIAIVLVPITGTMPVDVVPRLAPVAGLVRWLLSSVLVAVLAAFFRVVFYFVDETQGLAKRRQRSVEQETESRTLERKSAVGQHAPQG